MYFYILRLIRPHQWIKNGFVFIGVLFAKHWDVETLTLAGLAFLAFCAVSSAVYVVNDILDVEADRQHPVKKNRPLARGSISLTTAWLLASLLFALSLAIAWQVTEWVLGFIVAYALLNLAYSWRLKHIAVLDVFIIATGFMLRILAGTVGLGIPPSSWLLLCGLMLTLFLGFAKRRAELLAIEDLPGDRAMTRRVLDDYTPATIEQFMAISAACAILAYSLYTVSPETVSRHGTPNLIYTVPFVIYGILRYILILHTRDAGHDTARDLYSDPHILLTVTGWAVTTVSLLL
ncbi:decaprenyl-phosphate phosphoribosyltransferase [Methylomarinovum caldicuralii]|uniref:Decaprenyl-phosphate phosphoribosyltransferase n=1 Tax=Methylomarinovum caldicuralii TaxID=438856 RepID=A0AAU9C1F5_9GAMM|nr:decaprenyl-phosphate phosphoribosyltransferase [Methylomarinovum caldicuralii]BCX80919.1 decaprenyl-phosphate phosphoribosyltransferase [Methylomarinovum caldicuralii]